MLTRFTEVLNKISTLPDTIRGQAASVKAAFDEDVNKAKDFINDTLIPEIEAQFETKDGITTNRKLSASGDFTGTWNGHAYTETDPALQETVNLHTTQIAEKADKSDVKIEDFLVTPASGITITYQKCYRVGKQVFINMQLSNTVGVTNGASLATVPSNCIPPSDIAWKIAGTGYTTSGGAACLPCLSGVDTFGVIKCVSLFPTTLYGVGIDFSYHI